MQSSISYRLMHMLNLDFQFFFSVTIISSSNGIYTQRIEMQFLGDHFLDHISQLGHWASSPLVFTFLSTTAKQALNTYLPTSQTTLPILEPDPI